jgi:CSLREA domain-containing protein
MPSPRRLLAAALGLTALLLGFLAAATPARAALIVVNSLADNGPGNCSSQCTLRDALASAASGDTIQFSVTGTIFLDVARRTLKVTRHVTIEGPGAALLAVDGQSTFTVLEVGSDDHLDVHVTISGLTIQNGRSSGIGGGILNFGTLTLSGSALVGNTAVFGGGGISIYRGTATVTNSTFTGNSAGSLLGGGAILHMGSSLSVTGSTLSGNSVIGTEGGGPGGAISMDDIKSTGTVTSSTFYGNTANRGVPSSVGPRRCRSRTAR